MVADNEAGLKKHASHVLDHNGHIRRLDKSLPDSRLACIILVQTLISRLDECRLPDPEILRTS